MKVEFSKFIENDIEVTKLPKKWNAMNENDQLDLNLQIDLDLIEKKCNGNKLKMNWGKWIQIFWGGEN